MTSRQGFSDTTRRGRPSAFAVDGGRATGAPHALALDRRQDRDGHAPTVRPPARRVQYHFDLDADDELRHDRAMSVQQLHYFVAVAEEQHVTRAAEDGTPRDLSGLTVTSALRRDVGGLVYPTIW